MNAARWTALLLASACGVQVVQFDAPESNVETVVVGMVDPASVTALAGDKPMRADPKQLALQVPLDGTAVPQDVAPLAFSWNAPAMMMGMMARAYELRISSSARQLRVVCAESSVRVPAAPWQQLLHDGGDLTVQLRALAMMPKNGLLETAPQTLRVRAPLPAGEIYVQSDPGFQTAGIADASSTTFAPDTMCTSGLAVSRDGKRLGIACSTSAGAVLSLPDLTVLQTLASDATTPSFGAFDPTGGRFVHERAGGLEIVTVASGALQGLAPMAMAAGARMMDPDWSPDGTAIVFAYAGATAGSTLAKVVYDPVALAWSEPLPIAGAMMNVRAPQFSPDGAWIALQTTDKMGGLAIVSASGGAALRIASMNAQLPTWWPSSEPGQAWLAYSAQQDPMTRQLWVAAVDLTRLPDPSAVSAAFLLPAQPANANNQQARFAVTP